MSKQIQSFSLEDYFTYKTVPSITFMLLVYNHLK